MNITCKTRELAEEIRLLEKVISDKTPIPILTCVLFEAADDTLALTATDLEVGLISICDAVITEPGQVALPAGKLLALLNQLLTEDVTIATNDKNQVIITSGTFKSRLQTWSVDDFPTMPKVTGDKITIDGDTLNSLIAKTNYAVSDKTQMYLIKGALFNLVAPTVGIIATDGFRISIATAAQSEGVAPNILIPSKTLDTLLALRPEGPVDYSYSDRHLFFTMGSRALFSRMVEGKFPNVSHVPKTLPNKCEINKDTLGTVLKRVSALIDKVPAVTLVFTPGLLFVNVRNVQVGDASEEMQMVYDGPSTTLCMNYTFMLDFIKQAENEIINIEFQDSTKPMIMIDSNNFMNIILGMHGS